MTQCNGWSYFVVDNRRFYIRHVEFSLTYLAVERGRPLLAGNALVASYLRDAGAGALLFTEDLQTRYIVAVDGRLCIANTDNGASSFSAECVRLDRSGRWTKWSGGILKCIVPRPDLPSLTHSASDSFIRASYLSLTRVACNLTHSLHDYCVI